MGPPTPCRWPGAQGTTEKGQVWYSWARSPGRICPDGPGLVSNKSPFPLSEKQNKNKTELLKIRTRETIKEGKEPPGPVGAGPTPPLEGRTKGNPTGGPCHPIPAPPLSPRPVGRVALYSAVSRQDPAQPSAPHRRPLLGKAPTPSSCPPASVQGPLRPHSPELCQLLKRCAPPPATRRADLL